MHQLRAHVNAPNLTDKSTPTHPPKNNNGKIHLYGKLTMFFIVKIALYIAVAMPRNSSLLKDVD